MCKKDYIWNPTTWSFENAKYLATITENSVITCDKIIEETKTLTVGFNEKSSICKTKNSIFCLPFFNYHCIIDSC